MERLGFSDGDVKRLKEDFEVPTMPKGCWQSHEKMKALLARLEAETSCADLLQLHYESGGFDDLDEGDVALIVQALEARRKAAGK